MQSSFCPNCFRRNVYDGSSCRICGYQYEPQDKQALAIGNVLEKRYLLGRVLGIGGFGITYLAYDMKNHGVCAVKEYYPRAWASRTPGNSWLQPNSIGRDKIYEHGREVFANEARILKGLEYNPYVVNVVDFFSENGTAYMVMEYIRGETISQYMRRKGRGVTAGLADKMLREVGEALKKVHGDMLLHRDISPDNIMMLPNKEFKLIDFGATRTYALNNPLSMSVYVKPGFAPFEQYSRNGHQGPWSDIYSLAATYYFMVSGKKPPAAPDRQMGTRLKTLAEMNIDVSQEVSDVIDWAMQKNYGDRPQSVDEFLRAWPVGSNCSDAERKPYLKMEYFRKKEYGKWQFNQEKMIIGRYGGGQPCDVYIQDKQISSLHCVVYYNLPKDEFLVVNYSKNRTYIRSGALEKGQWAKLKTGDWFYMQTDQDRYIFYVEVK